MFNVSDSLGINLLSRLGLGFSHLREHRFSHKSQDMINPLCSCNLESKSISHFFLRGQNFTDLRKYLMNEHIKTDLCKLTLNQKSFTKLLLYGDGRYDSKTNTSIILASIKFIYSRKRSELQLIWWKKRNICLRCLDFQCLLDYINGPDKEVLSYCVYLSVFFRFFINVNCFVCWYHCNKYLVKIRFSDVFKEYRKRTMFKIDLRSRLAGSPIFTTIYRNHRKLFYGEGFKEMPATMADWQKIGSHFRYLWNWNSNLEGQKISK